MEQLEDFEIDAAVRGNYKSADLYLVPKGEKYARLFEEVLEKFGEDELELVIDESSMPLPYYEAMEIPLDVFEEEYEIEDEDRVEKEKAVSLCRDLLELGFFDIGFKGKKVSLMISHNGYINVKPRDISPEDFREKIESIGEEE